VGEFGVTVQHPFADGLIHLVQMTGKEMVGVIDDDQIVCTRQGGNEFGNFTSRAMLIIGAMNK